MHHHPCLCRLLDNLASFGFGRPPTGRPRKTDDRDRRSAAELLNAETHGVSGLVELPAGRMPQRCALHEICIGCASLPPPSSFLLHVPFVLMASSVGSYPLYLLRLFSQVGITPPPCPCRHCGHSQWEPTTAQFFCAQTCTIRDRPCTLVHTDC